ncbi:hypothetical protein [Humisphaera borealis]|uniref:Uncharacterized protein n=1 Tax=Humisphaera borealis TaxID=2807512 RepID=A0A7M2WWI5_9BACT|nr:hypothetical protein [Humisphaera borealis]QOV89684.1 hypothetical protein IPV69_26435 [Humisphaera borealis]
MKSFRVLTLIVCTACAFNSVGCVRGMTYKMAMPESMTIGTLRADQAKLDSALANQTPQTPQRFAAAEQ